VLVLGLVVFLEPDTVEQSIHEAYIDTINKAQHYIYIENQFFISLPYNNPNTKNQIAEALYKRIIRAFRFAPRSLLRPTVNCDFFSRAKEVFRVFVVMPLLPGFEGEVGGPTGTSLHAITHWNYASISQYVSVFAATRSFTTRFRGKDSIIGRLQEHGIENPSDYISFYGLRTHSTLNNEPITELIYVHSKLMIVDRQNRDLRLGEHQRSLADRQEGLGDRGPDRGRGFRRRGHERGEFPVRQIRGGACASTCSRSIWACWAKNTK
jgi:phospholipase D1/2